MRERSGNPTAELVVVDLEIRTMPIKCQKTDVLDCLYSIIRPKRQPNLEEIGCVQTL